MFKNMLKKYKKHFLTLHLYISLFFIPMALFYKITGAVGIFQYFGKQDRTAIEFSKENLARFANFNFAERPSTKEERQEARKILLAFMIENSIEIPISTNIKDEWHNKSFILGNVAHYIELPKRAPTEIIIYKRDLFANLIQLHFARAGVAFNVLAFCFVIFLFITYVTGILICNFSKKKWRYSGAILCGLVVMLACMYVSVYW